MKTINETYRAIEANYQPRSKWDRGVKETALDILESLDMPNTVLPEHFGSRRSLLLNGARDWSQYSYDGCGVGRHVCLNTADQDLFVVILPLVHRLRAPVRLIASGTLRRLPRAAVDLALHLVEPRLGVGLRLPAILGILRIELETLR